MKLFYFFYNDQREHREQNKNNKFIGEKTARRQEENMDSNGEVAWLDERNQKGETKNECIYSGTVDYWIRNRMVIRNMLQVWGEREKETQGTRK